MIVGDRGDQLYKVKDAKKKTIYDYTIEYLEGKYNIMYNEISHDFQISFKDSREWSYLNLNSLIIELAKAGIDISTGKLEILIRSELIQKIADDNPHLYQRDVERIVNTIFEEITGAMSDGDRVELRGFGAFSVKKRDARVGRNPRTGETVHVEEKHVPFFKTGKLLRDRLNGNS